jgi:hypothetical protein
LALRGDERAPDGIDVRSRGVASRSPRLTEPWFCCAEPTESQLGAVEQDAGGWV